MLLMFRGSLHTLKGPGMQHPQLTGDLEVPTALVRRPSLRMTVFGPFMNFIQRVIWGYIRVKGYTKREDAFFLGNPHKFS